MGQCCNCCSKSKPKQIKPLQVTQSQIQNYQPPAKTYNQVFSHNDEMQAVPLMGAISWGICHMDVDIFCIDDKIVIGHYLKDVDMNVTLESLYLNPLKQIIQQKGCIFQNGQPLTFYLDIKEENTNFQGAYPIIHKLLQDKFSDITSYYDCDSNQFIQKYINIIITGYRDWETIKNSYPIRFAQIDARISNISTNLAADKDVIGLISDNFQDRLNKNCCSSQYLNASDKQQIKQWVDAGKQYGKRLRLWATKEDKKLWRQLLEVGGQDIVINSDLPQRVVEFFQELEFQQQAQVQQQ